MLTVHCRASRKNNMDFDTLHGHGHQMIIDTDRSYANVGFAHPYDLSPPSLPSEYQSPTHDFTYTSGLPYYGPPQDSIHHTWSNTLLYGDYPSADDSRSPISTGSSSALVSQWGAGGQSPAVQPISSASSERGQYYRHGNGVILAGTRPYAFDRVSSMASVEEKDEMEQQELVEVIGRLCSYPTAHKSPDITSSMKEQRYIDSYWTHIHPVFPIVHRPTFGTLMASPLVRASMLALGASVMRVASDVECARRLHEQCAKILQRVSRSKAQAKRVSADTLPAPRGQLA